jgi:branched-chain amino acid transport system permease protein
LHAAASLDFGPRRGRAAPAEEKPGRAATPAWARLTKLKKAPMPLLSARWRQTRAHRHKQWGDNALKSPAHRPGWRISCKTEAAPVVSAQEGAFRRMDNFIQQLINGLTLGSIYGLIAIGYTMVFGIIGMINFAHGDLFMLSEFIALIVLLFLTKTLGFGYLPVALFIVLIAGMSLTSVWNWTIERLAYRPLRGSFRLAPLISAIGMSTFLSNFAQVVQGPRNKPIAPMFAQHLYLKFGTHNIAIQYRQIVIVAVTAVLLVVFWWLVQRTNLGRAQRACEQDRKMAALIGVDVDRTISITFVIGAALAAVAGAMYVLQYGVVNFSDGFLPGVKAFTAAVLGGIGSLPGAVLGGLLIGLIETLWQMIPTEGVPEYKDVAAFSILAIVLIFMPSGILGRPEIEKV